MFWTVTQALMSGLWTTFEIFILDVYKRQVLYHIWRERDQIKGYKAATAAI